MTTDLDLRKRVTQERIQKFQKALEHLESRISNGEQHTFLTIEADATRSEISRLLDELDSLNRSRAQADQQPVQHQDLHEKTLGHAITIAEDLGILSNYSAPNWDIPSMLSQLATRGMDREFLKNRLLVSGEEFGIENPNLNNELYAASLQRVLGLDDAHLAGVLIDHADWALPEMRIQLKAPRSANADSVLLYSRYIDYLVNVIVQAMFDRNYSDISGMDPEEMRQQILSSYGELNFSATLKFAWDRGIPVVPLDDAGKFEGALWRHERRPVIILNLHDQSESRWLLLLLHELAHLTQDDDRSVIVLEGMNFIRDWNEAEAEHEARWFALDVAFGKRAEELTERIVNRARASVPRLKAAIVEVARAENVDLGILADFLAFQLSKSNVHWWGTATNLQPKSLNPLNIARAAFYDNFDNPKLSAFDSLLLAKAVPLGDI